MKTKSKSVSQDTYGTIPPQKNADQSSVSPGQEKLWKFFDQLYKEQDRMHDMLVGKLLTVIDAITESDSRQKAIKDLIHDAIKSVWAIQYGLNGAIHERLSQHYNPEYNVMGSVSNTPNDPWLPALPTMEEYKQEIK